MINHQYKCIFIHVIKTGGVSVCSALNMRKKQFHAPASDIKSITKGKWDDYFTFSFTRNPWDKMVSQYFIMVSVIQKILMNIFQDAG